MRGTLPSVTCGVLPLGLKGALFGTELCLWTGWYRHLYRYLPDPVTTVFQCLTAHPDVLLLQRKKTERKSKEARTPLILCKVGKRKKMGLFPSWLCMTSLLAWCLPHTASPVLSCHLPSPWEETPYLAGWSLIPWYLWSMKRLMEGLQPALSDGVCFSCGERVLMPDH